MFEVGIEAVAESETRPIELHKRIWRAVAARMRARLKRKASANVLNVYLHEEQSDGYFEERWYATATELNYSFRDPGGCCPMSSVASLHWARLAFADILEKRLDPYVAEHGYRIASPRLTVAEVFGEGPSFPLIEIGKTLYCVAAGDGQPEVFSDSATLEWEALSDGDRARVDSIVQTGFCQCQFCIRLNGLKSMRGARTPTPLPRVRP